MVMGLVIVIVSVCAATVFMMALYVRSLLRRLGSGRRSEAGSKNRQGDGITIEGEYTVQGGKSDVRDRKQ
jgi:hypothetical protein